MASTMGSEHRHAQQLGPRGGIPGCPRNHVPGADHLGNIVDRRPQEHPRGRPIETDGRDDQRIENHGQRTERGDTDDREQGVAFAALVTWQHGGDRERRRRTADADGATGQNALARAEPERHRHETSENDGRDHCRDHQSDDVRAEAADLFEADPGTEQRNPDPEHLTGREFDPWSGARFPGEEIDAIPSSNAYSRVGPP